MNYRKILQIWDYNENRIPNLSFIDINKNHSIMSIFCFTSEELLYNYYSTKLDNATKREIKRELNARTNTLGREI